MSEVRQNKSRLACIASIVFTICSVIVTNPRLAVSVLSRKRMWPCALWSGLAASPRIGPAIADRVQGGTGGVRSNDYRQHE